MWCDIQLTFKSRTTSKKCKVKHSLQSWNSSKFSDPLSSSVSGFSESCFGGSQQELQAPKSKLDCTFYHINKTKPGNRPFEYLSIISLRVIYMRDWQVFHSGKEDFELNMCAIFQSRRKKNVKRIYCMSYMQRLRSSAYINVLLREITQSNIDLLSHNYHPTINN